MKRVADIVLRISLITLLVIGVIMLVQGNMFGVVLLVMAGITLVVSRRPRVVKDKQ